MGDEGLMYLHGVWTNLGGAMFRAALRVVPHATSSTDFFVVRAMDYGLYDPACVLWLVVYPKKQVIEVAGELYERDRSVDQLAESIYTMEARLGLPKPRYSVLDPKAFGREGTSMKSIATELQSKGLWFARANNDRLAGWSQVMRYLYRGDLRVWEHEGANLLRTLPMLQRDPKKPNDLREHQEDHAADTLRYGIMAIWEGAEQQPVQQPQEPDPHKVDLTYDKLVAEIAGTVGDRAYFPELGEL
jgi:hypothetical protein